MNCTLHPDVPAAAFCRTCGRALCPLCERPSNGTIYCSEHVPVASTAAPGAGTRAGAGASSSYAYSPYSAPPGAPIGGPAPDAGASPGLAFLLGLIPGVGAIYNGQYVKGLIHVVILGVLISIVSSDGVGHFAPMFGLLIGVWVFYMAFEAFHTAKRRQMGQQVDEFSSIVPLRHRSTAGQQAGPVALILIGVLFLLNTMDIVRFSSLVRFWPVGLIVLGGYMLYNRVTPTTPKFEVPPSRAYSEANHERNPF